MGFENEDDAVYNQNGEQVILHEYTAPPKKKRFRIAFNAPVTLTFTFLCFIATLLGELTEGMTTELFFMTYYGYLTDPLTYIRLFTHVLGHSGWEHFLGNASFLLLLGPMLEEKHGGFQIVKIIALTALSTGLINFIFFTNVGLCGASGVVFAFILLASYTNFKQGEMPITIILVAVIYIGQQIYDGLFYDDNISNMAHIVGGLVGAVSGFTLNKRKYNNPEEPTI